MLTQLRVLAPLDARLLRRNTLLRWLIVLPLVIALLLRWLLPVLLPPLGAALGLDLQPHAPLLTTAIVLTFSPLIYGQVLGFLLLHQRDEGTLLALRVTPLPIWRYTLYRLALPGVLGIVVTPAALILAGASEHSLGQMLLCALAAAAIAPCLALALPALAANKVQGMALLKASGVLLVARLAIPFVPMPTQLLLGVSPTYWPTRFAQTLLAGEAFAWTYALDGWLYSALVIALVLRVEAQRAPQL
jgi:fluoroquinolone transport system permease protein